MAADHHVRYTLFHILRGRQARKGLFFWRADRNRHVWSLVWRGLCLRELYSVSISMPGTDGIATRVVFAVHSGRIPSTEAQDGRPSVALDRWRLATVRNVISWSLLRFFEKTVLCVVSLLLCSSWL
jgi:hypothetical protein